MSLEVFLFDDRLRPIGSNKIEILESNRKGVVIDAKMSRGLTPRDFGANLTLPSPAEPVIIWTNDYGANYAPANIGFLNGRLGGHLDVILYPLPQGGLQNTMFFTDPGGSDFDKFTSIINENVSSGSWTQQQGNGVNMTISSVFKVLAMDDPQEQLLEMYRSWVEILQNLGIFRNGNNLDNGENNDVDLPVAPRIPIVSDR